MVNHPNRGKDVDRPGRTPRPEEILAIRTALHLTQTGAAHLIYVSLRAWQQWEGGERKMHPAFWDLFRRKTRVKVPVAAPGVASEAEVPGVEEKPPEPV
jgi:DNA (cytosine-5)-methyltransferase 1